MKKKKKKRGRLLIGLGLLCILGAASLTAYNEWDGWRAAKESDEVVAVLKEKISSGETEDKTEVEPGTLDADGTPIMPTIEIDGYEYIGILEVPDEDLQLPVMAEWDYTRLKISPCRYSGSYLTDDLVICGHNYARHFSPIKWLDIGAEVYFTDVNKNVRKYIVSNRETVQPTSVDEMIENSKNSTNQEEWDLTLFTCNTGGQTRCAVRCVYDTGVTTEESQSEEN